MHRGTPVSYSSQALTRMSGVTGLKIGQECTRASEKNRHVPSSIKMRPHAAPRQPQTINNSISMCLGQEMLDEVWCKRNGSGFLMLLNQQSHHLTPFLSLPLERAKRSVIPLYQEIFSYYLQSFRETKRKGKEQIKKKSLFPRIEPSPLPASYPQDSSLMPWSHAAVTPTPHPQKTWLSGESSLV